MKNKTKKEKFWEALHMPQNKNCSTCIYDGDPTYNKDHMYSEPDGPCFHPTRTEDEGCSLGRPASNNSFPFWKWDGVST